MGLLSRSKLLTREKFEVVKVDLGNDDYVFVRQMTGHERDQFERSLIKENKEAKSGYEAAMEDFRAKLAVNTICDEEGKPILEARDYPVLSNAMGAAKLEKIVNAAQKLNAISAQDKEELIKNSSGDQVASSSSDSVES